jgi:hypothetical protein
MNKQEKIDKLVEETLNCVDNAQRAAVKPYLFTRIQARMNKETESAWEKAAWFIARPAVAFAVIGLVVLINATVIFYNKTGTPVANTDVAVQNSSDEFSYTVSGIYEIENTQP